MWGRVVCLLGRTTWGAWSQKSWFCKWVPTYELNRCEVEKLVWHRVCHFHVSLPEGSHFRWGEVRMAKGLNCMAWPPHSWLQLYYLHHKTSTWSLSIEKIGWLSFLPGSTYSLYLKVVKMSSYADFLLGTSSMSKSEQLRGFLAGNQLYDWQTDADDDDDVKKKHCNFRQ